MKIRIGLRDTISAFALAAAPALALASTPNTVASPLMVDAAPTIDVTAHLWITRNGLELALGGARLELRVFDEGLRQPDSLGRAAGAHELRARFEVDGRETNLLLRFVPSPDHEPPAR